MSHKERKCFISLFTSRERHSIANNCFAYTYKFYGHLFHGRKHLSSIMSCLQQYITRVDNSTGTLKLQRQCRLTLRIVGIRGISVLDHCLECISSFDAHLAHSSEWFNIYLTSTLTTGHSLTMGDANKLHAFSCRRSASFKVDDTTSRQHKNMLCNS